MEITKELKKDKIKKLEMNVNPVKRLQKVL